MHGHIEGTLAADAKVDSGGFDQLLDCGLDQAWFRRRGPIVRHADYIGSWLEVLREDNRAIVRAASQASKAADYLLGFLPGDEHAAADSQQEAA